MELALAAWEAASHSDVARLAELCSPDLVWHTSGRGPLAGAHRGLEAALDHLVRVGNAADHFSSDLQDVLANDRRVALLIHVSGRRPGATLETDYILIFEIAGGKIAEVWAVPRDQYGVDEFWRGR